MNDFGKRLEAALNRQTTSVLHGADTWVSLLAAVRAANAQVSAPAPVTGESPAQSVDISGAGAGVDLADAMCQVRHAVAGNIGWARLAQREAAALLSHIESLERIHKAASDLSAEAEEYDFPDGLGRGASQYAWDTLEHALEAIYAARKEGK